MTTIAYKGGILAADTQLTDGNISTLCRKIDKWPDGTIAACAGNENDYIKFREYILGNKKKVPKVNKNFQAITIEDDKQAYHWDSELIKMAVDSPHYAIGSGCTIANAGMHLGLTARQAVKLSGEIEINTNTIIDYYDSKTQRLNLSKFPK